MKPTINAIIFDVGRVLVHYDPHYIMSSLLPNTPYAQAYIDHLFLGPIWQDLDHGTCTVNDAIEQLEPMLRVDPDYKVNAQLIFDKYIYYLTLNTDTKALFETLERHYPIYILSNFQDKPFQQLMDLHPFLTRATGMVVSAHVKKMKPNPDIYEHLLSTYALTPSECVFIDDMPENIATCRSLGMHGIVFDSAFQTANDLAKLGVHGVST